MRSRRNQSRNLRFHLQGLLAQVPSCPVHPRRTQDQPGRRDRRQEIRRPRARAPNTGRIRRWAIDNGHQMTSRGPIPDRILEAFHTGRHPSKPMPPRSPRWPGS
ncbi:Lsr2 family protein [Arthrobacter sp. ISL-72]|nr:Lsr2 family protein [Arthrobacter sp. ISL-72]